MKSSVEKWGKYFRRVAVERERFEFMFVYMVFPQLNDCINENHVEIISSY